jgi:hypothetical protein
MDPGIAPLVALIDTQDAPDVFALKLERGPFVTEILCEDGSAAPT